MTTLEQVLHWRWWQQDPQQRQLFTGRAVQRLGLSSWSCLQEEMWASPRQLSVDINVVVMDLKQINVIKHTCDKYTGVIPLFLFSLFSNWACLMTSSLGQMTNWLHYTTSPLLEVEVNFNWGTVNIKNILHHHFPLAHFVIFCPNDKLISPHHFNITPHLLPLWVHIWNCCSSITCLVPNSDNWNSF